MILDVIGTILEAAVTKGNVRHKQMLDEGLGVFIKIARELDLTLKDLLVDHHRVSIIEGINSSDHLISQDTEGPPVNWLSVALVQKHLRCQILRSATKSVGTSFDNLGETKIGQLEVTILINQDIFRFQIAIKNVLGLQVLKHEGYLRAVEHSLIGSEVAFGTEISEEFTTSNVWHQEVQVTCILGETFKTDQERMIDFAED